MATKHTGAEAGEVIKARIAERGSTRNVPTIDEVAEMIGLALGQVDAEDAARATAATKAQVKRARAHRERTKGKKGKGAAETSDAPTGLLSGGSDE